MRKNPYKVLGIARSAEQKDIKKAYRRAAKSSHPDRNAPNRKTDRFREIQEAYETLSNERRKKACDRDLARTDAAARGATRCARRNRPPTGGFGVRPVEPLDRFLHREPIRLAVEILLSPREALRGGRFPIRLPVEATCPDCRGALPWVVFCHACRGTGRINRELGLVLELPPGIVGGSRTSVPFDAGGCGPGVVELHFSIDPRAA